MTGQPLPEDHLTYVALGDSISIDQYAGGIGRGGASLLAHNRDDDFPDWAGRDLATRFPGMRSHLLATDGGTTQMLLAHQLPQLEHVSTPAIVTLTIGGNDMVACYSDTSAARRLIRTVGERVGQALDVLRARAAPEAALVVGTVYDPSDGSGETSTVGLPPWPDVVPLLAELNATLGDAARQYGAGVADIHGLFLGHGLASGHPAQGDSRPANRQLWYCNIIEPNAWGASAVREAFWSALTEQLK